MFQTWDASLLISILLFSYYPAFGDLWTGLLKLTYLVSFMLASTHDCTAISECANGGDTMSENTLIPQQPITITAIPSKAQAGQRSIADHDIATRHPLAELVEATITTSCNVGRGIQSRFIVQRKVHRV